jgi:hypothetical protein
MKRPAARRCPAATSPTIPPCAVWPPKDRRPPTVSATPFSRAQASAYNHALHLKGRAKMMQDWADFLEQTQRGLRCCRFQIELPELSWGKQPNDAEPSASGDVRVRWRQYCRHKAQTRWFRVLQLQPPKGGPLATAPIFFTSTSRYAARIISSAAPGSPSGRASFPSKLSPPATATLTPQSSHADVPSPI